MLVARPRYIERIKQYENTGIFLILTGMRRSGKSTILKLYKNDLISRGVEERQIIEVNMEDIRFESLSEYHALNEYLESRIQKDKKTWIFIDEIQEVSGFEKTLSSIQLHENVEICVTGSNSQMLSGELATKISGRYVEIPVYPFSFKEYLTFNPGNNETRFREYIQNGGLPASIHLEDEARREYIRGIYNTVLLKDIVQRKNLSDVSLLESIGLYLADNISNPIAPKRIADTLTSQGRKTSPKTVDTYLQAMKDAYLIRASHRYDVRGKRILAREQKYYFTDTGLRQFLIGDTFRDLGRLLENVVYIELKRRGYTVFTGKSGDREIDFIARKGAEVKYFQVSASIMDDKTREREIRAFDGIPDNYPKILLTMDTIPLTDNGIIHQNIIDFLLEDNY